MSPPPPLLLVANPGSRRAEAVEVAAAHLQLPLHVLPWIDVMRGTRRVDEALHALGHPRPLLRFDSPGGDLAVERAMLVRGADEPDPDTRCARLSASAAERFERTPGQLIYPRQAFLGFRATLAALATQLEGAPEHIALNHPDDIALMFDKPAANRFMASAGTPVPEALEGLPEDTDALLAAVRERGWERIFAKLANGSSAVGVVAIDLSGDALHAVTSTRVRSYRGELLFHNSLRLTTYRGVHEVRPVLDFLCSEGAQVERWIRKATYDDNPCDLRVVVVDGVAAHRVVRVGRSPMTNLHLGNARGTAERLEAELGEPAFRAALNAAEQAAKPFTRSFYAGVDVLVEAETREPAVIEINAFGDLIPGILHDHLETVPYTLREALRVART